MATDKFSRISLPVSIRRCRERDLGALEWFGAYTAHREIIREAFDQQTRGENLMLIADIHGFPAGQAWIQFQRKRSQRIAVLWALRVFPFLQGSGIGSLLIQTAEELAAGAGSLFLEVGVEEANTSLFRFYRHQGYQPEGEEQHSFQYMTPDGVVEMVDSKQWIFRKPLQPQEAVS